MLQWEHSAILSTFIKLPFVIKIFVLTIFEWPFYIGFTMLIRWVLNHIDLLEVVAAIVVSVWSLQNFAPCIDIVLILFQMNFPLVPMNRLTKPGLMFSKMVGSLYF